MHVGFRAIRKTVAQLIEDAEFTAHVVGGLGLVAERRTAQDEFLFRVFQQVGQVRRTARKLADRRCAAQAGNVRLEVRIDQAGIEFFARADAGGLVSKRHAYPFCLFWRPDIIG
ncbi:hypothetical protein D3C81_1949800 [compost metagenome]